MDRETHEPVDLLEGREAEVLAEWLKEHPGVEGIVRDRGGAYAEGARQGAPDAKQVADRFHVAKNVSDALDEIVKRRPSPAPSADEEPSAGVDAPAAGPVAAIARADALPEPDAAPAAGGDLATPARPLSPTKQRLAERRATRVARWRRVHELRAHGGSLRGIADALGINQTTVRRLLECPEPPSNLVVHPRPGGIPSPKLAPYAASLQRRWREGCTNGCQVFRELVEQGYGGSSTLLLEAIRSWRPPKVPKPLRHRTSRRRADPRKRRWLLLRPPEQLDAEERAALDLVLVADPALATAHGLTQRFRKLLRGRDLEGFHAWLADAQESGLPSFVGRANGMLADREAVEAAFTERWSNGVVEGTVHKIKLLKRQGYGRGKLDLLRCRVRVG